ncbi:hypothetical protein GCM10022267_62190 [Lentzea roselyniae]|uniref:Htaa protein n=1 Tax=Lentzea roselyniae TaxID=531940 RepID=A0ABP7BSI2_9PSEU
MTSVSWLQKVWLFGSTVPFDDNGPSVGLLPVESGTSGTRVVAGGSGWFAAGGRTTELVVAGAELVFETPGSIVSWGGGEVPTTATARPAAARMPAAVAPANVTLDQDLARPDDGRVVVAMPRSTRASIRARSGR